MPQVENEFQVGDVVEVAIDQYTWTVRGTIGEVIAPAAGYEWPWVRIMSFPGGINASMVGDKFQLDPHHLRKVDPNEPRLKTEAEILEILSRKIDSKELFEACLKEIGSTMECSEKWYQDRDLMRKTKSYFKVISVPPGCIMVFQDENLHLSKCKTKVAFVENEDKQKRDIWTVMGYGRYLTKYHPELDNEKVKKAVDVFNYDYGPAPEVHFGENEEDFIRAIKDGPSESCMAKLNFKGHIHPAAVYAAGDIKVAWLERDGRVSARTLINKETKAFSRVYGDEAKLRPQLEALGYESKIGALAGCRLLKIPNQYGDGFIMAYVDAGVGPGGGSLYFEYDGQYFRLNDTEDGRDTYVGYDCGGITAGSDDDDGFCCDRCGDGCDEDDLYYIESEERSVCRDCIDRRYGHAIVSRRSNGSYNREYVNQDNCVFVVCLDEYVHEEFLCELDVEMDYYSCEYIYNDDGVTTVKDVFTHRDDCEECGTDDHGCQMFIHKKESAKVQAGELFKNSDGDLFWYESVEVKEWVASATCEDHDPNEYVDVYVAPEVKPEAPKAAPVETAKIKVGDMVKVLNNNGWGPVGHVGRVLYVRSTNVVVETPGGAVHKGGGLGWVHRLENVRLVEPVQVEPVQVEPVQVEPVQVEPVQKTWKNAYLRMQERGIEFSSGSILGQWVFNGTQRFYKIDPNQAPPSDWREIYKEAQDNGVEFESCAGLGPWSLDTWRFDSEFNEYRLKETI